MSVTTPIFRSDAWRACDAGADGDVDGRPTPAPAATDGAGACDAATGSGWPPSSTPPR